MTTGFWKKALKWTASLLVIVGVAAGILATTDAGHRAGGHLAGLFIDVPIAPLRLRLPLASGPHRIGVRQMHLVDAGRKDPWHPGEQRELMITLWYPAGELAGQDLSSYMSPAVGEIFLADSLEPLGYAPSLVDLAGMRSQAYGDAPIATTEGGFPVLLFSPGGGQLRALGTGLNQELASHGYVVIAIDHTYEAPVVEFPGGRLVRANLPEGEDVLERMIAARVADVRFVLDTLTDGAVLSAAFVRQMNLSRIGTFGHSAGGFTSFEVLGQDERVDAALNLDGSLAYSMSRQRYGAVVEKGLSKPFMFIGAGTSGPGRLPHTHKHAPDWASLWRNSAVSGADRVDVYLPASEHFNGNDQQFFIEQLDQAFDLPDWLVQGMTGTLEASQAWDATRHYVRAFFDHHLKGLPQEALSRHLPAYPQVELLRE